MKYEGIKGIDTLVVAGVSIALETMASMAATQQNKLSDTDLKNCGLTSNVISELLVGRYNKVISSSGAWSYSAMRNGSNRAMYFTMGASLISLVYNTQGYWLYTQTTL